MIITDLILNDRNMDFMKNFASVIIILITCTLVTGCSQSVTHWNCQGDTVIGVYKTSYHREVTSEVNNLSLTMSISKDEIIFGDEGKLFFSSKGYLRPNSLSLQHSEKSPEFAFADRRFESYEEQITRLKKSSNSASDISKLIERENNHYSEGTFNRISGRLWLSTVSRNCDENQKKKFCGTYAEGNFNCKKVDDR